MATEDPRDAIVDAVLKLTERALTAAPPHAEQLTAAARNLAEAGAWMTSPNQPH